MWTNNRTKKEKRNRQKNSEEEMNGNQEKWGGLQIRREKSYKKDPGWKTE